MSYDIALVHPETEEVLELREKHPFRGGTYVVGGTNSCEFNITYNYAPHFVKVFGPKGIRTIYGMTGTQSLPLIRAAITALGNDTDQDYWKSTEGNARLALLPLEFFASAYPHGKWKGD